eukprot:CAMPEP_0197233042 /NCGR_PEP_ID=MMETSP1429-20130617/1213_1 /TAXON_ID=49237 /ORGANISM="Chaetoceros  sp., Strain UNC1202" /LENGTH=53 /DNA_ID=CAMNT_0042691221 /DNA_START=52 /DNA_END=210 /DNA_ORIENTATION=-
MQATSSQVTAPSAQINPVIMATSIEGNNQVPPSLMQAASASKRSHLLVRRRRR